MFFRQAHSDHQPMQPYQLQAPNPQQATGACHCSNDSEGQHHGAGSTMMPSGCMQHVLHRGLPPRGPGHHTTGGTGHVPATQQHHAASSHHTWQPPQHHQPPPQQQQQQHRSLEGDTAGRGLGPARLYSAFKASLMRHDQAFGPQLAATSSHPSNSSSQAGTAAAAAAAAGPSARGPGSYNVTHMNPVAAQQQKQLQDGSQSMWHYQQHQEHQQQQQQQCHLPSYPQHQTQRGQDPHQAAPHQPYGCNTLRCAPTGSEYLECDEVMCNVAFPAPYIASRGAADAHPATAAPEAAAAAATGGGGSTGWAAAGGPEADTSLYRTSTGRSSAESDRSVYHALHQQRRSSHSQRSLLGRGAASMMRSSSGGSSGGHGQEEEDDDCMEVDEQLERYMSSAGRRCGIAVMSVYTDINSPVALAQANALMARVKLPGGVSFVPVEPDFFLWRAATAWSFPAYSTVLASSYFQRLLVALPHLAQAAATAPSLQGYCRGTSSSAPASSGSDDRHVEATMRSIQVTCLYVALKVADQVHALGLLRFMLTAIGGNVHPVPLGDAELVEARLLDGLGWRLGPFFAEDDLDELGFDSDVWGALE